MKKRGPLRVKRLIDRTIAIRMILYFSLLGIILLMTLGIFNFYKSSTTLTSEIISYTTKIMDQITVNLDFYFNDIKSPMILLATNSFVQGSMEDYNKLQWDARLDYNRKVDELLSNINTYKPYIDDMVILGKSGYKNNLSSMKNIDDSYDFFSKDWVNNITRNSNSNFKILSLHKRDYYYWYDGKYNTWAISAAFPVYKETGALLGIILCDLNIDKVWNSVKSRTIEKTGKIFIVDQDGQIIFHPDKSLIGEHESEEDIKRINSGESGQYISGTGADKSLTIYETSGVTGWKIVADIPINEIYGHSDTIKLSIYTSLIICILLIIIISALISFQITKPLYKLISRIKQVESGDFTSYEKKYGYGEMQVLGEKFEDMVYRINNLIVENYQSKLMQQRIQFHALQAQINPHFLFNTIQLIETEIVCGNNEESANILVSLSYLLRYSMDYNHDMVTLKEEIDYIERYLGIYSKKYEGKLKISVSLDPTLYAYMLPKLILQPIVENSIIHAFPNGYSNAEIRIECYRSDDKVHISVTDNGIGIKEEDMETLQRNIALPYDREGSIGLRNVNQRIKMKYGEEFGTSIASEFRVFTRITITFPDEV